MKTQPGRNMLTAQVSLYAERYPWLRAIVLVLSSGLLFGIGLRLSINTFLRHDLIVCWPLVGLQIATLLRMPRRDWPPVVAGMAIGQILFERSEPFDEIINDTLCDLAELLIGAYCLPALNGVSEWIKQPRLLQRFVIWPMVLGPALTGLPAAAVYSHELHVSYWSYWVRWFTGDMLGVVLWLPLGAILMSSEICVLFTWKALPRTMVLLGTLSLAGWCIFNARPTPVAFILMPLLLLIALKLGFSGSVIAVNILCVISAQGTLHHIGPFGLIQEPYSVTTLQVFLAMCMLMCFPISILLLERDDFEQETRHAYERMERLAISDGLTGLANRRRFDTVLEEEWRRAMRDGEPISLMMIDVDCFKLFNDVYGHLAGDDCLRRIAASIQGAAMRAGDLTARFGGEEFVVVMPRTGPCGVAEAAEMIRSRVEEMNIEHERNPHRVVTISLGCCSIVPAPEIAPQKLIEAADQALYSAKLGGRNRVSTLLAEVGVTAGNRVLRA